MVTNQANLADKKSQAIALLEERARIVVALSGGVDSAVLLDLAICAVGRANVLAVTGRSHAVPEADLEDARNVARVLRASHEIVDTSEFDRPGYRANAGDRCYHCRSELFETLGRIAAERGFRAIAYGAIRDDLGDFRPGMQAAADLGVCAPLLEAGLTKQDVRRLAAESNLPVREKPASPCLSSRIPAGIEVTPERIRQIRDAESALRDLGFGQFRVRYHGDVARLELDDDGSRRIQDPDVRVRVVQAIRGAGFRFAALDLEGFRSGSLNPSDVRFQSIHPIESGGQ